jgi:hypothetical protein
MTWATHPADTVGTPSDPGPWTEAANIGATLMARLLASAESQVRAYAPKLAEGDPVPDAYVLATVLQARDVWQASRRVGEAVAIGDGGYAVRVRPLSDAIKQLVRPPEGVPGFGT